MNEKTSLRLRIGVVGIRGMGRGHAKCLRDHPDFELCGVCDLNQALVDEVSQETGSRGYTDFLAMIRDERLDVISIATDHSSHAKLTILAANSGVKAILCEKPMATNLKDARAMKAACDAAGVKLVVNHQRRVSPDLLAMRDLIQEGAIGDVLLMRGWCAGDVLSDGTHLVDSLCFLAGDVPAKRVRGMIYRDEAIETSSKFLGQAPGCRYGHLVESGGFGVVDMENGVRLELQCGDMPGNTRCYQDYEIVGTKGILRRVGDGKDNLFISRIGGGDLRKMWNPQKRIMEIAQDGEPGSGWEPVAIASPLDRSGGCDSAYGHLYRWVVDGVVSPMSGDVGLADMEIVMGIYESARLHQSLSFPITQEQFPLDLLLGELDASRSNHVLSA